MCKKDVQAKEDILRKGKYFCVESPLCLHEAGKEGYLKQKNVKQVSGWSENRRCQHAKEWKLLKGEENENAVSKKREQLLLCWNPAKSPRGR